MVRFVVDINQRGKARVAIVHDEDEVIYKILDAPYSTDGATKAKAGNCVSYDKELQADVYEMGWEEVKELTERFMQPKAKRNISPETRAKLADKMRQINDRRKDNAY